MRTNKENNYKDEFPVKTVGKLKRILEEMKIEVEEEWSPQSTIGTLSLRLNIKGTKIGSNGKGMTEDYARASAYAELFERYQNMKLQGNATLCNVLRNNQYEFQLFPDEKLLSAEELAKENNAFIKMFLKNRNIVDSEDMENAIIELSKVQKMDYNLFLEKDKVLSIPFYSVKEHRITYVPFFSANLHYGSNGMCAGNTASEALVQGLSEIIERVAQTKIVMEQVKLPDVPEEYLMKHPAIYNMYKITQQIEDYAIFIKDCSFGGKYSAAALVIVEKNTGKFGIKVGAHPDYNIAIERLFTEATQGMSLENFAKKTVFDFYNRGVTSQTNLLNGFKTGDALYPYQLLSEDSEYKFIEPADVSEVSNKEMLQNMMNSFLNDGYDVLIHDVSYLGFPSYQVLVPGISEMNYPDANYFEAENTRFHVQQLLNQPEYINRSNCKYVISVLNFFKHSLMDNSMSNLTGCFSHEKYPAKEVGLDNYYFLSMCYILMGDYEAARKEMWMINTSMQQRNIPANVKYRCMEYYMAGMANLKDHNRVMEYIKKLFDNDISNEVGELFSNTDKVLVKQYPLFNIQAVRAAEDKDVLLKAKEYLIFEEVFKKYKEKQKENVINQMSIGSLFCYNNVF